MRKIIVSMTLRSLLLLCGYASTVNAQTPLILIQDTISVGEVLILPSAPDGTAGFKATYIDKKYIKSQQGNSLVSLLNNGTSLYIKNYGAGGLSTSSFRGMGANHTRIVWEGMRIDNPMIGQSDLSTIICNFIDDLTIYNGGNPGAFGNRGPGGTLAVKNVPEWGEGTDLSYSQKIASFSDYSEALDLTTGYANLNYRMRAYVRNADNDYKYTVNNVNNGDILKRTDASLLSRGILQEVYYKNPGVMYAAKLWYNYSNRELPGSITFPSGPGNENQLDESVRGVLSYENYKSRLIFRANIGYVSDWMYYSNNMFAIESRNLVQSMNGNVSGKFAFSEASYLSLGLEKTNTRVSSNNFEEKILRNRTAIELIFSHIAKERLGVFASVNQEIIDNELLRISPSLGLDYRIFENRDYHINGSIGMSNHLPSLNDLYWIPGGNPELKTETASNIELSFLLKEKILKRIIYEASITAYYSELDNMIVWIPLSEYVWGPENIAEVLSRGIEFDQTIQYSSENHHLGFASAYNYTSVSRQNNLSQDDTETGKQLIYVPVNTGSLSIIYGYRNLSFSWIASYTGLRYTKGDNTDYLPQYWVNNLSLAKEFDFRKVDFIADFRVNNIFNTNYQNVLDYPMPLRSYQLSLSIKIGNR